MKFRVLITGFEPFGVPKRPKNRSWEIVKLVQARIQAKTLNLGRGSINNSPAREIEFTCVQLPVEYGPARTILEQIHSDGSSGLDSADGQTSNRENKAPYDLYLHIGEGKADAVYLETRAHRVGYARAGNGGPTDLPPNNEIGGFTDDIVYPTLNIQQIILNLNTSLNYKCVYASSDAGRYLCEYTLYISTALSNLNKSKPKNGGLKQATMFLHVPPNGGPYSDDQLADLVYDLCNLV